MTGNMLDTMMNQEAQREARVPWPPQDFWLIETMATSVATSVSSIYIWSKNLTAESEAKDGRNRRLWYVCFNPLRGNVHMPFSAIVMQVTETDVQ